MTIAPRRLKEQEAPPRFRLVERPTLAIKAKLFNPEELISLNPERISVNLLDPNDPVVTSVVWPMVEQIFSRYTADREGNDYNGDRIKLTGDRYDTRGKSKVVVANQDANVLGSFRVVHANSQPDIQPPIDAMVLMKNHDWPQADTDSFGEFGRFAVHPNLPREEQQFVLRFLYREAILYARGQGFADNVYVVLAGHVHRFVTESGIDTTLSYPEAVLNWDNPEASKVFDKYPHYWQPERFYPNSEPPKLYRYLPQMRKI